MDDELREALSDYAHDTWSRWMDHLFSKGKLNSDGTFTIDSDKVDRWQRQMLTPYEDLSEEEKESDRAEADKMLAIMGQFV